MAAEAHIASPALPCHHKMAAEEVAKAQLMMTELQYLMLLDDWPELTGALLEQALLFSGAALSMLRLFCCSPRVVAVAVAESSSGGGPEGKFSAGGNRENPWVEDMSAEALKKGKSLKTWITVTTAPHFDGYQWKKYGQKLISNSKYPRNYYRCTYFRDQGCLATKTVQRKDDRNEAEFVVAYKMQHSCRSTEAEVIPHDFVVESAHQYEQHEAALIDFRSLPQALQRQCSQPVYAASNNSDLMESGSCVADMILTTDFSSDELL